MPVATPLILTSATNQAGSNFRGRYGNDVPSIDPGHVGLIVDGTNPQVRWFLDPHRLRCHGTRSVAEVVPFSVPGAVFQHAQQGISELLELGYDQMGGMTWFHSMTTACLSGSGDEGLQAEKLPKSFVSFFRRSVRTSAPFGRGRAGR